MSSALRLSLTLWKPRPRGEVLPGEIRSGDLI